MKQITTTHTTYSHPEVEKAINDLHHHLNGISTVEVKEDAQYLLTEEKFKIKVVDVVHALGQKAMNSIKSLLQVPALVTSTTEKEQVERSRIRALHTGISDKLIKANTCKREAEAIHIDERKKKYSGFVNPVAFVCGTGDAVMAYLALSQSYSPLMATISAVAIGLAIAVSHFAYTPWIKQAGTFRAAVIRSSVVLLTALGLFAFLSNFRADALNNLLPSFSDTNTIVTVAATPVNGWAVCGISYTLFLVVFFLSLVLHRTKEERMADERKQKLLKEYKQLQKGIEHDSAEIKEIENKIIEQKAFARSVHAYAVTSIIKCRISCMNAIVEYKKNFIRHSLNPIPDFFSHKHDLLFDEDLHLFPLPQTESE